MSADAGTLYVVPTPIGNLEDMTARAIRIMRECSTIFAEDTRRTAKLCAHFSVATPLRPYHAHSSEHTYTQILELLMKGKDIALVSDAGTPLVSDPGADLVRGAQAVGAKVVALPGATSVTTAYVASGIRGVGFRFLGFLPRTGNKRALLLNAMRYDPSATIFFEAANRALATLEELRTICGDHREVALCRELSKLHEEVVRDSVNNLCAQLIAREEELLGEVVIVLSGAEEAEDDNNAEIDHTVWIREKRTAGLSAKDVARILHEQRGVSRRDAYRMVLACWDAQ